MKCPKCGYLGFETSDRCRNCGYDFSLTVTAAPSAELPLHQAPGAGEPLADLDLGAPAVPSPPASPTSTLDLDRVIGAEEDSPAARTAPVPGTRGAPERAEHSADRNKLTGLPLFGDGDDDTPLITAPRPPQRPLAVRRTTPEVPRTRARVITPRLDEGELAFHAEPEPESATPAPAPAASRAMLEPSADSVAPPLQRLLAALVDVTLLGALDVAVVYLTLALAGLTREQLALLPLAPVATFLALLNFGYLVIFTAASGQTIGKMLTGIQVIRENGGRVDVAGAVLRAAGCAASLLTAGLGYLPALIMTDGRALQDRIAQTRVVRAR